MNLGGKKTPNLYFHLSLIEIEHFFNYKRRQKTPAVLTVPATLSTNRNKIFSSDITVVIKSLKLCLCLTLLQNYH